MKQKFKISQIYSHILKKISKIRRKKLTSYIMLLLLLITLILVILQITLPSVYALSITEIMFNPEGSDTGREWIELWLNESDGCINITEYRLLEEDTNHHIYSYNNDYTCDYAIIYSDINKFLQYYNYLNDTYFPLYKSTFSLSNDGELISIKKEDIVLYEINYTQLIAETNVTEGHSLEYKNNSWGSSELLGGDPGNIIEEVLNNIEQNITNNNNITNLTNNLTNNSYYNNNISCEYNYSELCNINLNITDYNITNNNTNNITENVTINSTNNITSNITSNITNETCHASIKIVLKNESQFYENSIAIKFYNIIDVDYNNTNLSKKDINYSIDYWIEDLLGNVVKNLVTTTNQNEKSFTPNIIEKDAILKIKNVLTTINCNITRDSSEQIILIKNSNYQNNPIVCEKCEPYNLKCEDKISTKTPIFGYNYTISNGNSTLKPIIKVINICDKINNSTDSSLQSSSSNSSNNYELANNIVGNATNAITKKNASQSTSRATSMILYESGNIKNRFYAVVGLLLVGLAGIIILSKKLSKKIYQKMYQKKSCEKNTADHQND